MTLPKLWRDPDGFVQLGPELAGWASLLVGREIEKRGGSRPAAAELKTWAELFNEAVRPNYGELHSPEQMKELEEQVSRFVKHTAANHLQICKMRVWRDLRRGDQQ